MVIGQSCIGLSLCLVIRLYVRSQFSSGAKNVELTLPVRKFDAEKCLPHLFHCARCWMSAFHGSKNVSEDVRFVENGDRIRNGEKFLQTSCLRLFYSS